MKLFVLTCILLFDELQAIKVIESQIATKKNWAILKNSSLSNFEDITTCARFKTYQFSKTDTDDLYQFLIRNNVNDPLFVLLGSLSAFNCNNNPKLGSECTTYYKGEVGEMWRYGGTYGNIYLGPSLHEVYFPSWKPGEWRSFCALASLSQNYFKLYINNDLSFQTMKYVDGPSDGHKVVNNNLFLLHYMKGSITDVNIWRGIMKEKDMFDWMNCKSSDGDGGDIINWKNASIDLHGTVSSFDMSIGEICMNTEKKGKIMAFQEKMNFEDGKHFCGKVGEMAVAKSEEILGEMVNEVSQLDGFTNKERFYVGYTDIDNEGVWVDENTGERMTFNKWDTEFGFPSNWHPNADCAAAWKLPNNLWFDGACYREFFPVCKMKNFPEMFQLRGVSIESSIDTYYVWLSKEEFLGLIGTKMVHSNVTKSWEIYSTFDDERLAHTKNKFKGLPLGTFEWTYDKLNISSAFFNFHLAVEQPGSFCCDDGLCLSSELVCDNIPNCRDKSDERNCDMVKMPTNYQYDKIRPPSQIIKVNKKEVLSFIDVFATVTILDVLDINDAGSFFDIFFKLNIQWKDLHLKYEFLKENPSMNVLNDSIAKMIWIPSIKFFHLAGSYIDFGNKRFLEKGKAKALMSEDMDQLYAKEIHQGTDTLINFIMTRRVQFSCAFENVVNFPFGSQICEFHFFIEGTSNSLTNFKPKEIVNLGPDMLGQYYIQEWSIYEDIIDGTDEKIITASVTLSRQILSVFMVTYLPTILMNIINQTLNYISGDTKESLSKTIQ